MSAWELPKVALVNGTEYEIRSDYRAVLDILAVFADVELTDNERGDIAFEIFYPAYSDMPPQDYEEAAKFLTWFVGGGDMATNGSKMKLMDWIQDFPIIVGPVNRVLGLEVREAEYLHWWSFLGAYMEIGDCLFAQVVAIRRKKKKGKRLEKHEREFYSQNRELVEFKTEYTDSENEFFNLFGNAKEGMNDG